MQTHMQRATFDTSLGRCAIRWHDAGLTAFELPEARAESASSPAPSPPAEIVALIARVRQHLAGDFQDFSDLHYDFATVPVFNVAVLQATLAIKAGQIRSYGEIAKTIGQPPAASRGVGAALGANRWPLIIPCHRVVAADGKMTGFSGPGGVRTKVRLLQIEGALLIGE